MSPSILVVDDDRHFTAQMGELLDMHGWSVRIAKDGVSALAEVQKSSPDIVLLDLILPQMSGNRVLSQLRALPNGSELPVLVTSATGRPDGPLAQEALRLGAAAYLAKPFNHDDLLALLRRHARAPKAATPAPQSAGGPASDAWSGLLRPATTVTLLATIFHCHHHGVLTVDAEGGTRRFYILNGYPVWVDVDDGDGPLLPYLVHEGALPPEAVPHIEQDLRRGTPVRQAVIERALLTNAELQTKLPGWVGSEVEALLGTQGRYQWKMGDDFVGRVPIHEVNPFGALWAGVRRHLDLRVALRDLEAHGTRRLARTRTFPRLFGYIADSVHLRRLGEKLCAPASVGELRAAHIGPEDEILRALWLMHQGGLVAIQDAPERPEGAGTPGRTQSQPAMSSPSLPRVQTEVAVAMDVGRKTRERIPAIPNDVDIDTFIARDHVSRMELDHYAFLGLTQGATALDVDAAYQQIAPRYRLRSGGDGLAPETRRRARELLARLMQAVEVLSDSNRRAAYDAAGAPAVGLTAGPAPSTARMQAVGFGPAKVAPPSEAAAPKSPTTSALPAVVIVAELTLDPMGASSGELQDRWSRAREAMLGGDARKACAMLDALRAIAPAEPGILADLGWARWVAGPPDDRTGEKALEWLQLAQTFDPQHRQAVEAEVRIRQALIQGEELRRALKRLLRLKPELAWARALEGEIDSATASAEQKQGSALGRLFGRRS